MNEIRLLFGKPAIKEMSQLISAIRDLQSSHGLIVQALDGCKVAGNRHIHFAVEKALAAISEQRNIAKDAGMEIMRYASGERQIERALAMGVTDRTQRVALILVKEDKMGSWPEALELSEIIKPDQSGSSFDAVAVKKQFQISLEELAAVGEERLEDLVIERVALADTYR